MARRRRMALVVSADADTADLVSRAFHDTDLEVACCQTATAASGRLEGDAISLIVIDASSSDTDAFEACRRCRDKVKSPVLPIVVLVDDGGRERMYEAYDSGASHVFINPRDPEFLRRMLLPLAGLQAAAGESPGFIAEQSELPDALLELNAKGRVTRHLGGGDSDAVLRPGELVGHSLTDVWPADVSDPFLARIRRSLTTRQGTEFGLRLGQSTASRHYSVRLIVKGRDCLLAVFRDAETSPGNVAREDQTSLDTLTNLPGREAFLVELEAKIADYRLREKRFALLCVDIDRFAQLNATTGRSVGDAVLRIGADRLRTCVRGTGRNSELTEHATAPPAGRTGSDEFCIMLEGRDLYDGSTTVAARLHEAFGNPFEIDGRHVNVGISIGVAVFPVDGKDANSLYDSVLAALDEARTHAQGVVTFYSDTIRTRALRRVDSASELRWAFDHDQLDLHYLPCVDLNSGEIVELEGLLRWDHPLRRSVPITEIIPLAEATGLIHPLSDWILRKACADARSWCPGGIGGPRVSVNLSEQEFVREGLADLIANQLQDAELESSRMQLELTERTVMKHPQASAVLEQLNLLGVNIAVDDFGTGPSSLSLLAQLPIDTVKIDRRLIEAAGRDRAERAVCAAIIAMAHELDVTVIAEGVESESQLEALKLLGCDAAQGFLFTQPVPCSQVRPYLDEFAARRNGAEKIVDLRASRQKKA